MESSEFKSRIHYINHKGKRILHIDHSELDEMPALERAEEFFALARQEIDSQPEGSVLLLTTMSTKMRFNSDLVSLEREFSKKNTPYIKKSAVVGASITMKAIIPTFSFVTGREIKTFDTTEEALDWLVKE